MAEGFALTSDLSALDMELEKLAKKSEDTSVRMRKAFQDISTSGVEPLIEKLRGLNEELTRVGDNKVGGNLFSPVSRSASKAIDDVNRVLLSANNASVALDKIFVGGKSYSNSNLTKINNEIDSLYGKLKGLQKQLHTAIDLEKVGGLSIRDKSSIDSLDKESSAIMRKISLLERERSAIIMNARESIMADQEKRAAQANLDKTWQPMFEKAEQREKARQEEFAQININAKAKADLYVKENEDYRKSLDERRKFYEKWINETYEKEREAAKISSQSAKASSEDYIKSLDERRRFYEKLINDTYEKEQKAKKAAATNDSKIDKQRYEEWLKQKHIEMLQHKRIEKEKTEKTRIAIAEQQAALTAAANKKMAIARRNSAESARIAKEEERKLKESTLRIAQSRAKGLSDGSIKAKIDLYKWEQLQKKISGADEQIQKLTASTKAYEITMNNINSGKGGIISKDAKQKYEYEIKAIEVINRQRQSYIEQQKAIVRVNQEIAKKKRLESELSKSGSISSLGNQSLSEQKYKTEQSLLAEHIKNLDKKEKGKIKNQAVNAKEEERIAAESARRIAQIRERLLGSSIRGGRRGNSVYIDAISSSRNATSIKTQIDAINKLKEARDRLSKTDSNYKSKLAYLNEEIVRNQREIDKAKSKTRQLSEAHMGVMDTAGQLQRRLALVFSVSQIQGYINKMISVRGEFELQQRSLQAILKNTDKADKIWDKTVALAVKSPFRVKELVTYTKQLAAYRIEADKLYETNKMLADVSAGLGVSMNRLILAYGQVKAANYLRGTELRQFSEAGVDMLGELAKYYSEIEKRTVSVGEVFERISKRLVTFEDVDTIFKRITSAGGLFYNMQEIQAETLKGQISNLYDSLDLMFNEIGKSNDGILKGSVKMAKGLVENWQMVAVSIKGVVAALGVYKLSVLAARLSTYNHIGALRTLATVQAKNVKLSTLFTVGLKKVSIALYTLSLSVKKFIASNAWFIAISAIIGSLYELYTWNDKLNEQLGEINQKRNAELSKINSITAAYKKLINTQSNNQKSNDDALFDEKKKKLQELIDYANEKDIKLNVKLEGVKKENIDNIVNEIQGNLTSLIDLRASFAERWAEGENNVEGWFGVFGDNLATDMKQANEAANKLFSTSNEAKIQKYFEYLSANYDKITNAEKKFVDEVRNGKKEMESEQEFMIRRIKLFRKVRSEIGTRTYMAGANEVTNDYNDFMRKMKEFRREIKKVTYDFNLAKKGTLSNMSNEWLVKVGVELDTFVAEQNLNKFVQNATSDYIRNQIRIPLVISTPNVDDLKFDEDWKQRLYDKLNEEEGPILSLQKRLDKLGINFGLTNYQDKTYEQAVNTLKALDEANKKDIEIYETNKKNVRVTEEQYLLAQKRVPVIKELLSLAGVTNKKERLKLERQLAKQSKDEFRNQINLIKDANKAYKELRKTKNQDYAEDQKRLSYKTPFLKAGLGDINKYDFENASGLLAAFEKLRGTAAKAGLSSELDREIANVTMELDLELDTQKTESLSEIFEDMFGQYEMTIQLEKEGVPSNFIEELFGLKHTTLDDLNKFLEENKSLFDGTKDAKKWEKMNKKVQDKREKEQIERLKKYNKYLMQAQSERIKMKIEEMRELEDIEKTYTDDSKKKEAKKGVREKYSKMHDEMAFEDFKKSGLYSYMFSDLDSLGKKTLSELEKKLESMKNTLKDLPIDKYKELVKEIDRIKEVKIDLSPMKEMKKYSEEVKNIGMSYNELQQDLIDSDNKISSYEEELYYIDLIIQSRERGSKLSEKDAKKASKYINIETGILKEKKSEIEGNISKENENNNSIQKGIDKYKNLSKSIKLSEKRVNEYSEAIKNALSSFDMLLDAFGVAEDSQARIWVNGAIQIANMIAQVLLLKIALKAMEIEANMALGVIGWIAIALQAVATLFASIFGNKDKKKEKQIQREINYVESLERQYDKLGKAIEKAYSVDTLKETIRLSDKNIEEQIESRRRMIELENDRKKTDHDKILQWNREIEDLQERQEELKKQQVEEMGATYDSRTASREFLDAWLDAFKETGDGLSGLEDHFKEFVSNIVAEQAVMRGLGKIIEPLMNQITSSLEDDYLISSDEWDKINERQKDVLNQANQYLKDFYERFPDLIGNSKDSLSGLQKGIQGVTESTAEIIASYLNSIRFFVSDSNSKMKKIVERLYNNEDNNPMLSQLMIISKQTTSIHKLLDSVTKNGHPSGGYGIRVFMD